MTKFRPIPIQFHFPLHVPFHKKLNHDHIQIKQKLVRRHVSPIPQLDYDKSVASRNGNWCIHYDLQPYSVTLYILTLCFIHRFVVLDSGFFVKGFIGQFVGMNEVFKILVDIVLG